MKTRLVAVFLAVTAHAASAAPSTGDATSLDDKAKIYEGVGGALVAISAGSAIAASVYGSTNLFECGFIDNTCDAAGNAKADRDGQAVTGLVVTAAVAAAIGIPLLIKGVHMSKAAHRSLSFGLGPAMTNGTASGASASMAMRF